MGGMWPDMIVVVLPERQLNAGMTNAGEQGLVEAFIPELAVEALNECVLGWLARRDVVPVNRAVLAPVQDRHAGQLRTVVTDNGPGLALSDNDDVEFSGNSIARQRRISDQSQTFPAIVVNNTQNTEPPAIGQRV